VVLAGGGAGGGARRRAGPTWATKSASLALHSRGGGGGPCLWLLFGLRLDLAAMEGPQELLSGKLQLCLTPAAGTSLLLFRLNDAALRALQECRRQQVRPTPGPVFPSLYPSGSRASAGNPGKGTWGWEEASAGSDLPISK